MQHIEGGLSVSCMTTKQATGRMVRLLAQWRRDGRRSMGCRSADFCRSRSTCILQPHFPHVTEQDIPYAGPHLRRSSSQHLRPLLQAESDIFPIHQQPIAVRILGIEEALSKSQHPHAESWETGKVKFRQSGVSQADPGNHISCAYRSRSSLKEIVNDALFRVTAIAYNERRLRVRDATDGSAKCKQIAALT